MDTIRKITRVINSRPVIEGAGVHLHRAFGFGDTELFDPFLLLDDFRSDTPEHYRKGFPWHPHRGIETITYMLKGTVEHGDSLGNKGIISGGDVQWMTAGSGIIHQEMPVGDSSGSMHGFQLWANLPASEKMTRPKYRDVKSEEIPVVTPADGVSVKVICGELKGIRGPVNDIAIRPEYIDITLDPGCGYIHPVHEGRNVFAYVIAGSVIFGCGSGPLDYVANPESYFIIKRDNSIGNRSLVLFSDGDMVSMKAVDKTARLLLISGSPLREPVAWYGPIVMNTRDELKQAFDELDAGTFIRKH